MDAEKKSEKEKQATEDIGTIVGDLVVSGATMLAHSAAEAVVERVKQAAADSTPVRAVAKTVRRSRAPALEPPLPKWVGQRKLDRRRSARTD
jgi:hypothetical protein